jgi:23S rRNA pseudouridine1911/1915/1917 synthase
VKETIPAALDGERVDRVVAMLTGLPRSEVAELVRAGDVRIGARTVTTRSSRVVEGDVVEVDVAAADPQGGVLLPDAAVEVPIVHVDDAVVVVDKPAALVVHPGAGNHTGTMVHGLLGRFPELAGVGEADRPGVVHRLDRGTSGLLVVARTPAAYESLVAQLAARSVERRYLALVWGVPTPAQGMVDAPIGRSRRDRTRMAVTASGREARTRFEVVTPFAEPVDCALVSCRLETGRTHQIRVHLAAIGHPVVGDPRYRGRRGGLDCPRPFLHATRLAFDHPTTGERVGFDSPLPAELEDVLSRLR